MIQSAKQIRAVFNKCRTDKGELHGYEQMYHDVLNATGVPSSVVEVGIKRGNSLLAWTSLFPDAAVSGIDIHIHKDLLPAVVKNNDLHFFDSTKPAGTEHLADQYDWIIDDGNHRSRPQFETFLNLQNRWNKAYVIEDVEGILSVNFLLERLKPYPSVGKVVIYESNLRTVEFLRTNGKVVVNYYAMVLYHK